MFKCTFRQCRNPSLPAGSWNTAEDLFYFQFPSVLLQLLYSHLLSWVVALRQLKRNIFAFFYFVPAFALVIPICFFTAFAFSVPSCDKNLQIFSFSFSFNVFVCLCNCLSANAVIPAFSCMRAPSGQTESLSFLPFGILHLSLFLGQFDNQSLFTCYPCHPLYSVYTTHPSCLLPSLAIFVFSFNLR